MSHEENEELIKVFEQEFFKNSCPKKPKVYYPRPSFIRWVERELKKELEEYSLFPPLIPPNDLEIL